MVGLHRTHIEAQAGITLIELLITMTILTVVTTMIILSWIALQSSSVQTASANDSRSSARDALDRMSTEIRSADSQPGSAAGSAVFTMAAPTEVDFYSSFNVTGQASDGTGSAKLELTRMYLGNPLTGSSTTTPLTTLWLVRDTTNDGQAIWSHSGGDVTIDLADNVVNNSVPSTGSPTAVFTYGYRDTTNGPLLSATTITTANLAKIVSVNIRVIVDKNLNHLPAPVDLQAIVRPQNAPNS